MLLMRVLLWISLLYYSVSSNAQNRIVIDGLTTLQRYAENHSANFKMPMKVFCLLTNLSHVESLSRRRYRLFPYSV